MTEISWFWGGDTVGDAATEAPYTPTHFDTLYGSIFTLNDPENLGVLFGDYMLEVTDGGGLDIDIDLGRAWVNGKFYENDAVVTKTLANNDWSLIVLRHTIAANTVRITVLGSNASEVDALADQTNDGTYWDIPLATVQTSGGAVAAINDYRNFLTSTAVSGAWSRNGVLGESSWLVADVGYILYADSGVIEQYGAISISITANLSITTTITLPREYAAIPMVFVSQHGASATALDYYISVDNVGTDQFDIVITRGSTGTTGGIWVFWRTVGEGWQL